MKKWIAGLLSLCLLLLSGCGSGEATPTTTAVTTVETTAETTAETTVPPALKVGISLPNQTTQRWIDEGKRLTRELMGLGYEVDLENAQDDAFAQAEQVEVMLEKVDCLIIAPVDSISLSQVLNQARIPVIAYDRLIMNTDKLSGFVGYDSQNVGADVAQRIVEEKALKTAEAENRSYTVEFFMGDYKNQNDVLFYQGLLQVLEPYLQSGVLTCPSGRIAFEDNCVASYDSEAAGQQLEELLKKHYGKKTYPQIILTAHDDIAVGCIRLLTEKRCSQEDWPLITGQQTSEAGVGQLAEGKLFLSVHYDTPELVAACAEMVHQVLQGEPAGVMQWHNGEADIPANLLFPTLVDKENYHKEI